MTIDIGHLFTCLLDVFSGNVCSNPVLNFKLRCVFQKVFLSLAVLGLSCGMQEL